MFSSLLRKSKPINENLSLLINGEEIRITIRKNPKARRLILRRAKKHNGFVVTLPPGCTSTQALEFAQKHTDWISEQLHQLPEKATMEHGSRFPLRGVYHSINHTPEKRGVVWLDENSLEPTVCVSGEGAHIERRLRDWLKKQARSDLQKATLKYATLLDVRFDRISLRDQSSRWGSCSSSGNLSFSWRLVLAPQEVLNYVAAHEVAHLIEMNHSTAFWDIVEELDPSYKLHTKWLKDYGSSLHQYF